MIWIFCPFFKSVKSSIFLKCQKFINVIILPICSFHIPQSTIHTSHNNFNKQNSLQSLWIFILTFLEFNGLQQLKLLTQFGITKIPHWLSVIQMESDVNNGDASACFVSSASNANSYTVVSIQFNCRHCSIVEVVFLVYLDSIKINHMQICNHG